MTELALASLFGVKRADMRQLPIKVFQAVSRWRRGKTLGARICAIDAQGRILLVRHTYVQGWTFPGGGVDKGETLKQAAIRELREEAAVEALGKVTLHAIYSNEAKFPGDHVALFICRDFKMGNFKPNLEITEAKFFKQDCLPDNITSATRARLAEILEGADIADRW